MRRIDRRRSTKLACVTLCLLCAGNQFGTSACAQAQRSDNAQAPNQSYLTGDWGGVRPDLERLGVIVTLNYTNDFLANVSGGIKSGAVGIGIFQPQIDLDLEKLLGWQGDRVHIHGLLTHGPFFSAPDIGNILAVSNLEAGPVARLYAVWYEHNAPEDRWSVRTGLMLADSQFVQSETASNFINNGLSWPTVLAANLPASGPAYPLPAPGIRVRVKPVENVALQAAVFSGDPSGGNGSNQPVSLPSGTVISFNGGAFLIAEASYQLDQGKDTSGLPGAYRIGAWYHTSSHFADQRFDNTGISLASPQSTGIPLEHTGDYGIYGVVIRCSIAFPAPTTKAFPGSFAPAAYRTTAT
jgi:porin